MSDCWGQAAHTPRDPGRAGGSGRCRAQAAHTPRGPGRAGGSGGCHRPGGVRGRRRKPGWRRKCRAASHPAGNTAVVTTRHLAGLGTVPVSASGRTIYSPEQEAHGQIRCTGSRPSFWFPVTVTSATGLHAPSGLTGCSAPSTATTTAGPSSRTTAGPCTRSSWTSLPARLAAATSPTPSAAPPFTWQAVTASGAASGSGGGRRPPAGRDTRAAPDTRPGLPGTGETMSQSCAGWRGDMGPTWLVPDARPAPGWSGTSRRALHCRMDYDDLVPARGPLSQLAGPGEGCRWHGEPGDGG